MPFEKLIVWQKSMILAKSMYQMTDAFPAKETYGLVSQMRRSVVSIPSNIAEGSQRKTDKDFSSFIAIARGSCAELKTQTLLAKDLGFLSFEKADLLIERLNEVGKMLNTFYQSLANR